MKKHVSTLATVSILAIASWATTAPGAPLAASGAVPASSSPLAGALQAPAAACPTPAAATKPTWKNGRPEYDAFTAAAAAKDPAQKAQLAAAFAQKYPNSDYKNAALQMAMAAQAQSPDAATKAAAVATAEELIKSPTAQAGQLLPAYTIIAYLDPTLVQAGDPNMAAKMATLTQAAVCGQQLLASAPAAAQAQFGPVLTKALGFAQLNTKDYAGAIATLTKAAQQSPKDPLPYYWMGIAQVTKATPDYDTGIFDLAKASVLAPTTAAFKSYLNTVYTSYHGAADGLQDVITAATSNATPPAGFKILSKVDVENAANMAAYEAALEKQKNTPPPENSFAGIIWRLQRADYVDAEWKKVKGQGYQLSGVVTAVTAGTLDVAVPVGGTAANAGAAPTPNVHVELFGTFKTKRPKVGETVNFQGAVASFTPNPPDANTPFMLTMNEAQVTGFAMNPPPAPAAK